jgi:hypothetical protein
MIFQLIYSSVSSTPMQMDELEDILEHAQASNPDHGITGALVYADGFFLQILEGEREAVQDLMARIAKDLRHETIAVLQAAEVPQAAFADWKMAYVSATPAQVAQWAGLTASTQLPDVWVDLRQDPSKAAVLTQSILAVLQKTV